MLAGGNPLNIFLGLTRSDLAAVSQRPLATPMTVWGMPRSQLILLYAPTSAGLKALLVANGVDPSKLRPMP